MATPLYNSGLCFITGVVSEHTTQWQLNWDTVCKHNIVEVSAIGKFMISLYLDQVLDTVGIQYVLTRKKSQFYCQNPWFMKCVSKHRRHEGGIQRPYLKTYIYNI